MSKDKSDKKADKPERLAIRPVFAEAFRAFVRAPILLLFLALVVQVIVQLLEHGSGEIVRAIGGPDNITERQVDVRTLSAVAINIFVGFTSLLGTVLYAGLVERIAAASRAGKPRPSIREALVKLPYGRLIVADLVISVLAALGFVAFIIPGVVFIVYTAITAPLITIEGGKVWPTIKRSISLVHGSFWRVFIVVFVAWIVINAATELLAEELHSLLSSDFLDLVVGDVIPETLAAPIEALPIVMMTLGLIELRRRRDQQQVAAEAHPDNAAA